MNVHSPAPMSDDLAHDRVNRRQLQGLAEQVDVRRIIAILRRRMRLFGGVALVIFAIALFITLRATPEYTATANVMLDPRQQNVTNVDQVLSGLPPESPVVDTEVEVLR